ncbi:MAG: efflux RND transporter permease subunit [Planctomycetota bacterium]
MDPIAFGIRNPVKVSVGVILVLLFGVVALWTIPVQLTPDVDETVITVTTEWDGRSPDEIEKSIIEPQEDVLKSVPGLQKMTATASRGASEIELEFGVGIDADVALLDIAIALDEVGDYPEGVEEPVPAEGEAGPGNPIAWLILQSDTPGFDVQALGEAAEERIRPALERVIGVSEARVYGAREPEIHIRIDPRKVAQNEVTLSELEAALRQENLNVSAGELSEGQYETRVRVVGEYTSLDQIGDTVVKQTPAGPIRVRDLVDDEDGIAKRLEKRDSFVRVKGAPGMAFPVYREAGANVIAVMGRLRDQIDEINDFVLPDVARAAGPLQGFTQTPHLQIRQVYDETDYIYDALALVRSNLVIGGTLAVVVLLLFLRRWRPTLIVALAIPVSIIGTFVAMAAFGRNLNVISLAGLAFAVGMVVDNAIVVTENIDRHLSMGKSPGKAAYDGTKEVWGAVLASTLTTLAVFVPVLTIQEEVGQLFRDIALAICAAVTLSLIVSITVIPTASSRMLRTIKPEAPGLSRSVHQLFGLADAAGVITRGWSRFIYQLTERTFWGFAARGLSALVLTGLSLGGAYLLMPPADYLPQGNQNIVFGVMIKPPGFNIAKHEQDAQRVESVLAPLWEAEGYDDVEANFGPLPDPFTGQLVTGVPPVDNYFHVTFQGSAFHGAISADPLNVKSLEPAISAAAMTRVPGTLAFARQRSIFGRGMSGSRGVEIEVVGNNLDAVTSAAEAMMWALRMQFGMMTVQPTPTNFDRQSREITVEIDRVKAADLGLDVVALGRAVSAFVDGAFVGEYRDGGETIDILATRSGWDPDAATESITPESLADLPLAAETLEGGIQTIQLGQIATFGRTLAPQQIRRSEEERGVQLVFTPPPDMPLEVAVGVVHEIEQGLRAAGAIDESVRLRPSGSASKLDDVRASLLGEFKGFTLETLASLGLSRVFLALLVTYLLMAALFESWLYPLVIMFSVPLATVGGFAGLALVHDGWGMAGWAPPLFAYLGPGGLGLINPAQQLDTLTMLGFVILIGVVVNNAILIVHQALNFMRGTGEGEGDDTGRMGPRDAIAASVRTRMRPIFMTTATSVAGMLPLVLMPGAGSELYKGLGSVVVGGLIVATLFTLALVPLLFSLTFDLKVGAYRLAGWSVEELGESADA